MNLIETQGPSNHAQFFNEQRHGPKPWIVRMIRISGTQLVVEHNLSALTRRFFEWLQVVMGSTRTTVQTEQWQSIRALLLADYSVPNLEIAKRNVTFTNWGDRKHGIKFSLAIHDVESITKQRRIN